ncbi:MAG: formylglycine-generating enzyme family protein [Bradymonadia bacterium]
MSGAGGIGEEDMGPLGGMGGEPGGAGGMGGNVGGAGGNIGGVGGDVAGAGGNVGGAGGNIGGAMGGMGGMGGEPGGAGGMGGMGGEPMPCEPTPEVCDRMDNDCDEQVDEGVEGEPLSEPCYSGPEGTEGRGQCQSGLRVCRDGILGACQSEVLPSEESCDGVDEDCDGAVDENVTRACYLGPEGTEGVGACMGGFQACSEGEFAAECTGEIMPSMEVCNEIDDDCDGVVDEALNCPLSIPGGGEIQMIELPAGVFLRGSDFGPADELPIREVTIPAFRMSRTEVTVRQYAACVSAGVCAPSAGEEECNAHIPGREEHPINCVLWSDARTFAAWVGARLPTEAEWEYAARGGGLDRLYPWPRQQGGATCERTVMYQGDLRGCGDDSTSTVCSREAGNTVQGLCDMAGNVWEWVEDVYVGTYEGVPVDGSALLEGDARRVFRGGGWRSGGSNLRTTDRNAGEPEFQGNSLGFRLAITDP